MNKKCDFIKGDTIYFTPEFVRILYLNVCALVSDPNFKNLPLDEQLMWLKHKETYEKKGSFKLH